MARAIRNAIRANRFARIIRNWNPYFYSVSGRFAWITRISDSRESRHYPVLPFLGFLEKGRENPPKKQGFFIPTEPLKFLEKKGKTLKITRNSSQGLKNKDFQKNKERKDRVRLQIYSGWSDNRAFFFCPKRQEVAFEESHRGTPGATPNYVPYKHILGFSDKRGSLLRDGKSC